MKPRVRCYTWSSAWWYVFPDGVVCRMDPEWHETYETWELLREYGRVPFVLY
jgi:hypothetical protein